MARRLGSYVALTTYHGAWTRPPKPPRRRSGGGLGILVSAGRERLEQLGWERIVLVSATQVAARFRAALPHVLSERVVAESDLNLLGTEPSAIAEALEPLIDDAWLTQ